MIFASASLKLSHRNDLTSHCGLDLECGNLTLVCDTPPKYMYALSFGGVSLNLLE